MAKKNGVAAIPPPRSGRPVGPVGASLSQLEVGGHDTFPDACASTVRSLATLWGRRLKRRFVTRSDERGIVTVYREK